MRYTFFVACMSSFATVLITVLLFIGRDASAGLKSTSDVAVDEGDREASGSLGSTRASSSTSDYIGCYISTDGDGRYVWCEALDGNDFGWCDTTDSDFASVVGAIGSASHLRFEWNSSNDCTYIQVSNYSIHRPMTS